jgi:hypothetical protein
VLPTDQYEFKEFIATHIMRRFCKHVLDTSNTTSTCSSEQPLSKVMTQQYGLGDRAAFPRPFCLVNSQLRHFCMLVDLYFYRTYKHGVQTTRTISLKYTYPNTCTYVLVYVSIFCVTSSIRSGTQLRGKA